MTWKLRNECCFYTFTTNAHHLGFMEVRLENSKAKIFFPVSPTPVVKQMPLSVFVYLSNFLKYCSTWYTPLRHIFSLTQRFQCARGYNSWLFFFAETFQSFFSLRHFGQWDISVICTTVVLKLTVRLFIKVASRRIRLWLTNRLMGNGSLHTFSVSRIIRLKFLGFERLTAHLKLVYIRRIVVVVGDGVLAACVKAAVGHKPLRKP